MKKDYHSYIVHDDGYVYSSKKGIFLKPDVSKAGYRNITLFISGKRQVWKLHRLVATLFIPNPEDLPQINHLDGCKANNSVANLEWCTAYTNNKHARDTGLNNVSKSNISRWSDPEFKCRTASKISESRLGKYTGLANGNFKYWVEFDGEKLTVAEIAARLGMSVNTVRNHTTLLRAGKSTALIREHNMKIITLPKSVSTIESGLQAKQVE